MHGRMSSPVTSTLLVFREPGEARPSIPRSTSLALLFAGKITYPPTYAHVGWCCVDSAGDLSPSVHSNNRGPHVSPPLPRYGSPRPSFCHLLQLFRRLNPYKNGPRHGDQTRQYTPPRVSGQITRSLSFLLGPSRCRSTRVIARGRARARGARDTRVVTHRARRDTLPAAS